MLNVLRWLAAMMLLFATSFWAGLPPWVFLTGFVIGTGWLIGRMVIDWFRYLSS